jgi:hypothetical protein
VSTAIVALWLLAQHQLGLALIVMFLPPDLVSLALVFFVDLRPIQVSGMGKYLHRQTTRALLQHWPELLMAVRIP